MMDHMYDDDEEDDEDGEDGNSAALLRSQDLAAQRGKDERAYYDGLAKKEDERHNAMRADMKKRLLMLGELRQKLRRKQAELRAIDMSIAEAQNIIDFEIKKAYRTNLGAVEVDGVATPLPTISILSKDVGAESTNSEYVLSRAQSNIKQLQEEKLVLEKVIREMSVVISDEARALSQLQHTLLRM